jgi:GTPase SAR1 family protein
MTPEVEPGDCLGGKLLVVGDVNTGKTTLARGILQDLCARGLGERIAILDLAPTLPAQLARARGVRGVGGRLEAEAGSGVVAARPVLQAPRLTSASEEEAIGKAQANLRAIESAWHGLPARAILFINDISMALQAGHARELVARIERVPTVVANGYFGQRLGGGELTRHEKAQMQDLRDWFERTGRVIALTKRYDVV